MPRAKKSAGAEQKIAVAALQLAARHGWRSLTLEQIAKAAKISPAIVRQHFISRDQILPAIVRRIDRAAADAVGEVSLRMTPHDRLFEVMMARFDALQSNRAGILAILADAKRDPALARLVFPAHWQTMQAMLKLARLHQSGFQQSLAAAGLLGVHYWTLCAWQRDETVDMAKTMAALDRALRRAGMIAEILFRDLS